MKHYSIRLMLLKKHSIHQSMWTRNGHRSCTLEFNNYQKILRNTIVRPMLHLFIQIAASWNHMGNAFFSSNKSLVEGGGDYAEQYKKNCQDRYVKEYEQIQVSNFNSRKYPHEESDD